MAPDNLDFEYPKHIRFKCDRCALCCGDTKDRVRAILLMQVEANRISKKTLKDLEEFVERVKNREPYIYRMKTADGKCVFLRDSACTIYGLRPLICRFYPFELKDAGHDKHIFAYTDECPCIGMGPELEKEYFEKLFAESMKTMREEASKSWKP